MSERDALIYDWNAPERGAAPVRPFSLLDDTLRDGLQSTVVRQPSLDERSELMAAMARAGVRSVNLGMPVVSSEAFDAIARLTKEASRLDLRVVVAGRTLDGDMRAIVELAERTGTALEGHAFVGSSAIRAEVEGWSPALVKERTTRAIGTLVKGGLEAAFVTEDTTRSHPDTLRELFRAALDAGASRLCLCDTVGHATPDGVRRLLAFTREVVAEHGSSVALDWHGHADRGLALSNALAALEAGADRVHGTALGLGERAGNTPLELLMLNLALFGRWPTDLLPAVEYCRVAARVLGVPVPATHPLLGDAAFRTATGVHAAAIQKAAQKAGWLSDRVYGAVPSASVGRVQEVCVGPLSGRANVEAWLAAHGIAPSAERVERILAHARAADHVLSDAELERLIDR
ncbi:MAG TPA: 2-isopropylmalate synthase [Polyangiaceae bacterium]|nr:2-isopropylmalate synthase [Polyangiaceae bacterium]